jgi:hypothetical protein
MRTTEIDFDARYEVAGYRGIAWYLIGYVENETYRWDDEAECEYPVLEMDLDMVEAVMVGDDRKFEIDVDDLTKLDDEDYCHQCGQIGCTHDGLDRE